MTRCLRCHRQLKAPTETGLGPVCARAHKATPVPSGDLFFDADHEIACARTRVQAFIDVRSRENYWAVRDGFKAARKALGVWHV